eukprot:7390537-Prymnesium_polylepis.1
MQDDARARNCGRPRPRPHPQAQRGAADERHTLHTGRPEALLLLWLLGGVWDAERRDRQARPDVRRPHTQGVLRLRDAHAPHQRAPRHRPDRYACGALLCRRAHRLGVHGWLLRSRYDGAPRLWHQHPHRHSAVCGGPAPRPQDGQRLREPAAQLARRPPRRAALPRGRRLHPPRDRLQRTPLKGGRDRRARLCKRAVEGAANQHTRRQGQAAADQQQQGLRAQRGGKDEAVRLLVHSARSVLETVMLAADQLSRSFHEIVLKIAFEGGKAVAVRPPPAMSETLEPLPNDKEEEERAEEEEEVGNLMLLGDLAGAHRLASSELALLSHIAAEQPALSTDAASGDEAEQESAEATLGTALAGDGRDDEDEIEGLAQQSADEPAVLASPRGRGESAAKPCERATELTSSWLEKMKAALDA